MTDRQQFDRRYILKLSCPDQMGIVAAVASFLARCMQTLTPKTCARLQGRVIDIDRSPTNSLAPP